MSDSLQCYNKGCGQKFKTEENKDDACTFHPGPPFFHDAYKGWKCCNKKVTDFTEFLNIKGCTKGPHNPEKPPESEKPKADSKTSDETVIACSPLPLPITPKIRPDGNEPLQRLPVTKAASLLQALEQETDADNAKKLEACRVADSSKDASANIVPIGEPCKNNACQVTFRDETSMSEVCWHHPGAPIFHEGMKYWSCCQKKTSEFDSFMSQAGCTRGKHAWTKEAAGKKTVTCRYDWHQTGGNLIVTIYVKLTVPESSFIEANVVTLKVHLEFNKGSDQFDLNIPLWGAIDVSKSEVVMAATKVEIKLKKADPASWPKLQFTGS